MEGTILKILEYVTGNGDIAKSVTSDTDLINEVGLDSLQMINLMLSIEKELNITFDFDSLDFSHFRSFRNFCNFIKESDPRP